MWDDFSWDNIGDTGPGDFSPSGGYSPGEPGFDTGGSTPSPIQDPWATEPGYAGSPPATGYGPPGGPGNSTDGPGALAQLAKMLGMSPQMLLPLLASVGGGLYGMHQTNKAADQMQQGITNSNKILTDAMGGMKDQFKPYQDAGLSALAKMQAQPPSNLAGNFNPLGSGRGMNLLQMAKGGR